MTEEEFMEKMDKNLKLVNCKVCDVEMIAQSCQPMTESYYFRHFVGDLYPVCFMNFRGVNYCYQCYKKTTGADFGDNEKIIKSSVELIKIPELKPYMTAYSPSTSYKTKGKNGEGKRTAVSKKKKPRKTRGEGSRKRTTASD